GGNEGVEDGEGCIPVRGPAEGVTAEVQRKDVEVGAGNADHVTPLADKPAVGIRRSTTADELLATESHTRVHHFPRQAMRYIRPMPNDDETRWLDQAESETWLSVWSMMVWLPARLDGQLRQDSGLSHPEYLALSQIS